VNREVSVPDLLKGLFEVRSGECPGREDYSGACFEERVISVFMFQCESGWSTVCKSSST
jgi:hypothetical protein